MNETRKKIAEAVEIAGSRAALARKIGMTAQLVGLIADGKARVTAEVAIRIQVATHNRVLASELRPDLPWAEIRKPKAEA